MTSANSAAAAYDAGVETSPAEEEDRLRQLQLADLDAREVVERLTEKVEKLQAHLDGARESLDAAQADAARAAAELEAYPGEEA